MPARRLQKHNCVTAAQASLPYNGAMSDSADTHIVLDYRPSEFTGWEWGKTIGGHLPSREFELAGKRYRITLLAFGRSASSPEPVYQSVPGDPAIAYRRTLEREFGDHYSFRYRGGLTGQNEFRVRCYSVLAEPNQSSFGAQLYVVYDPGRHAGDPRAQAPLKWIQVVRWSGTGSPSPDSYVDNTSCPNPFFISGGLISVLGTPVFNFDNPVTAQPSQGQVGNRVLAARYLAETFLARDTLTTDLAGKDVIEIFGGIKYGWQLREVIR
jgi:hypothetical protein